MTKSRWTMIVLCAALASPATISAQPAANVSVNDSGTMMVARVLGQELQKALDAATRAGQGLSFDDAQMLALVALQGVIVDSGSPPYVVERALDDVSASTGPANVALSAVRSKVILALVQCPAPERAGRSGKQTRRGYARPGIEQSCAEGVSVSSISGFGSGAIGMVPAISGGGSGPDYRPIR